jgi:drug/metabolite transporter (DMT)-like permease
MKWYVYAIWAMLYQSGITLVWAHLSKNRLLSPMQLATFFFLVTTPVFLLVAWFRREAVLVPAQTIPWFLLMAVLSIGMNLFLIEAFRSAQPGYVRAIGTVEVAVVFLIAALILPGSQGFSQLVASPMGWLQIAGCALCLIGAILVGIASAAGASHG